MEISFSQLELITMMFVLVFLGCICIGLNYDFLGILAIGIGSLDIGLICKENMRQSPRRFR